MVRTRVIDALSRRGFLKATGVASGAALADMGIASAAPLRQASLPDDGAQSPWLPGAVALGNRFVLWQSPSGAPDPVKCPYRSGGKFTASHLHGAGPAVRALYRLYDETGLDDYKHAADRYAVFLMNAVHDPLTPYTNILEIDGRRRVLLSSAWMYGKALSPCYEWFCRNNPGEDAFELKAYALYRWLQRHRRDDSYFGVGYPVGDQPDAQFSCDLGEVGSGLVGFYNATRHEPALQDALGLADYFLTDYEEGSGRGVWSPQLGVWLVGPWPGGGAEHFTDQVYNGTGWGWSCLVVGEFLLGLRRLTDDADLRGQIDEKCTGAFRWCIDHCQFDDGAHGMFGRDDKWVGMTAAAVLLYAGLKAQGAVAPEIDDQYRPRIEKSWSWLLKHTRPDRYPTDGYIRVTGKTSKKPPENLFWLMAWTVEALLEGGALFGG